MSDLHSNVVVWRLEYFMLHKLMMDAGVSIRHNNKVGDLANVSRLIYSLIRKSISHFLIDPIKINGNPPSDTISKTHSDMSFELALDSGLFVPLSTLFTALEEDEDVVALNAFMDRLSENELPALISINPATNSVSFNVGKFVRDGYSGATSPNTTAFFSQLMEFAPIWSRVRVKLQAKFDESDIAQTVAATSTHDEGASHLERFKALLARRRLNAE